MALGWKTQYEKRLPADGLSNWDIFTLAQHAFDELGWEYLIVDEKTCTATTPTHWTLSEQIITIVVENDEVVVKSQSESLELYEAGRNKKNIEEELLPAFRKARKGISFEQLQSEAGALKNETLRQIKTGNRVEGEKVTFVFEDHEVTFLFIALNLLIFIVMMLKGVSPLSPSPEQILQWGGSVKYNITGGEWWRLITNLFVHIGLFPLLINMCGLYFIGLMVESILGKFKFLIAYLCAGIIASLVSTIYLQQGVIAGASGAVSGLYGVLLAFATTNYINKRFAKLWLVGVGAYAIFNIITGLQGNNDNAANIGGFIAGVCIGYLFYFFHFKKNLARAGGTRIAFEVALITAFVIFFYLKKNSRNDSLRFEKEVMQLNQIEVKAMTQMQRLQEKSDEDASKFLRDTALPEWKHFQVEIMKTDGYSLNSEFKQKRSLLRQYAALRVKQTELIYKSIDEGTTKYNDDIDEVSAKIDKIIDKLGN